MAVVVEEEEEGRGVEGLGVVVLPFVIPLVNEGLLLLGELAPGESERRG